MMIRFLQSTILLLLIMPFVGWAQDSSTPQALKDFVKRRNTEKPIMIEGVVGRAIDSESIWIHIENKSEFRKWTFKLSKRNLNIPRQEIRIWLKFVSPKKSINRGKEYNEWFKKKATYELHKQFSGRRIRADVRYLNKIFRLEGMVWTEETNINVWMVKQGWSFYLLDEGTSAEHAAFTKAEAYAREKRLGLWREGE